VAGHFTTNKNIFTSRIQSNKQISWTFHADDPSKSSNSYDMIIGRCLLTDLGMILNFQDKTVS
jgi:hypothetical protein